MNTTTKESFKDFAKSFANRFGWLTILAAALTLSCYSLFYIARSWGVPIPVAAIVSAAFDGIAITCADYSLKYARVGQSGTSARLATFMFAGLSAYINSQHAVIGHEIGPAKIFWAAPPIGAVIVYELHIRWERRRALANAGRIAPDLPVMGKGAWLLFPIRTVKLARTIVKYRMGIMLMRQTPGMIHDDPPFPLPGYDSVTAGQPGLSGSITGFRETPRQLTQTPGGNPPYPVDMRILPPIREVDTRFVRQWARTQGYVVPDRGPLSDAVCGAYVAASEAQSLPAPEPSEPTASEPTCTGENPVTTEVTIGDMPIMLRKESGQPTNNPDDSRGYL